MIVVSFEGEHVVGLHIKGTTRFCTFLIEGLGCESLPFAVSQYRPQPKCFILMGNQ